MKEGEHNFASILETVNSYYTRKITEFGATTRGVDWRDEKSQEIRFEQLLGVLGKASQAQLLNENCKVLDYGCGYGALLSYLRKGGARSNYFGFDCSQAMIDAALEKNSNISNAVFSTTLPKEKVDFSLASGIFNVNLESQKNEFQKYILSILDVLYDRSRLGFAFNMLTAYSDSKFKRSDLYYENPVFIVEHCLKNYSRTVNLSHGYQLFEFTVGVLLGPDSIGIRK